MIRISRTWLVDTAERAGWTGIQAAVAYLLVAVTALPDGLAAPITMGLVVLKALAARKVGDSESAAMLPEKRADLGAALRRRE